MVSHTGRKSLSWRKKFPYSLETGDMPVCPSGVPCREAPGWARRQRVWDGWAATFMRFPWGGAGGRVSRLRAG